VRCRARSRNIKNRCSIYIYIYIHIYDISSRKVNDLMPSQFTAHVPRPHGDKFLMRLISGAYFHFLIVSHSCLEKLPQHKDNLGITYLSLMI